MTSTNKIRNKFDRLTGQAKQLAGETLGDRRMAGAGRRKKMKADLKGVGEKVKDALRSGRTRRTRRS
ncbi:CsbD family protein [Nocardia sp. NBC_01327]|uniref:CsbD family protein n=1 Tax=Nocardia sp. NBC_01327 TaxID=2903593 RepID=UPI002E0D1852|nr:CsbD family protein [Nocardia sp. NBC_01327]